MATGPQHYAEAESDLNRAARALDRGRDADAAFWMQSAQVHATLAVAAATALTIGVDDSPTVREWAEAAGQTEVKEVTA